MDDPAAAAQSGPEPVERTEADETPAVHETVHGGMVPEGLASEELSTSKFKVNLANFQGPFDLLLQLISQHQLDVTEVALHRVTDDFIAYTRALGTEWNLDETTEFLVIAATLLDLKAARLLPAAEVESEDDLALLEARDLLFARVLQYRAYKQVAALFGELEAGALRRYPRSVALEDRFMGLLPEVMLGVDPAKFAEIAIAVFRPKPPPTVSIAHIHMGRVSVREHAALLRLKLAERGEATFSELVEDCEHTVEIVARFLALLELYREASVQFEQLEALAELHVRWTGGSVAQASVAAEQDLAAAEDEEYG
ncbi:segregation and condensation protein A [Amycolatopsis regifaucium]|uniref:Segregation and condensation protein A n=1 Tax=Amycolatopsis regifaucium TaxID=546365 RepID=A0A154M5L2_9PSEU|nr:segregation/condensation protein A [Amycolatopsis regifaucium]KZB79882.1 chromosome segregation protein ScpA [Amycolatopsis regifaucium]OKA09800.1 segregation/condensation protein A [Amycolatopsis regifaucium]SFJ35263.1 condensin subunit ScpA [Amycolatopsis regifaucium]